MNQKTNENFLEKGSTFNMVQFSVHQRYFGCKMEASFLTDFFILLTLGLIIITEFSTSKCFCYKYLNTVSYKYLKNSSGFSVNLLPLHPYHYFDYIIHSW